MPLYTLLGTPIQFTVTDKAAAAFNRMDVSILRQSLETHSSDVAITDADTQITVDVMDLFMWKKVTAALEALRELNGGYINNFSGDTYDPRLVRSI